MGLFKRPKESVRKWDGQHFTFSNFSYGLYCLDTPRSTPEQLSNLALTGGRNIWSERGALTNQYGYSIKGQLDDDDLPFIITSDTENSTGVLVLCLNGSVYRYTSLEGLKKYKTIVEYFDDTTCIAYNGANLYFTGNDSKYVFGGRYNDETDTDVTFEPIVSDVEITSSNGFFTILCTDEDLKYYWLDKKLCMIIADQEDYLNITVNSISPYEDDDTYTHIIQMRFDSEAQDGTYTVSIGEKTLHQLTSTEFTWYPEDYDPENPPNPDTKKVLNPKLMSIALNRLWIVDEDNTIYYSAVGNLTSFDEANGAGFFNGFYRDTSKILSIEEYFSGVLITKNTGMYHVRLTTNEYSFSSGTGSTIASSTNQNYINITKINNIGQESDGDHVIIGDEVIAYDSNSGNLVQAAYVNYMGNIQQGSILIHGSELSAMSLDLFSTPKRKLCYSFQEEVLLLYYGTNYEKALTITRFLSVFPRETTLNVLEAEMYSQGFILVTKTGEIIEDFKRGTVIPTITSVAEFEPIGLRGNKMLCGSVIEITELNGINYTISTSNNSYAEQFIRPTIYNVNVDNQQLPNLIYSDSSIPLINNSYAELSRWAAMKSSVSRLAAPLSGRDGLTITLEFEPNVAFCMCAINLPDFSQGE